MATTSESPGDALETDLARAAGILLRGLLVAGPAFVCVLLLRPLTGAKPPDAVYQVATGALGLVAASLVLLPVSAFLLALTRGRRRSLSDHLLGSACLGGTAIALAGVAVVWGAGVWEGAALGWLMVALGAAGATAGLRCRWTGLGPFGRSTRWGLAAGTTLFLILWLFGAVVQGYGANDVTRTLRQYNAWQLRRFEVSGRFAAGPDSTFTDTAHGVVLETRLTPGGFAARATLADERTTCSTSVTVAPAYEERAACAPSPNRTLIAAAAFFVVVAVLVSALVAWRQAAGAR